jgi:hypothetical protein
VFLRVCAIKNDGLHVGSGDCTTKYWLSNVEQNRYPMWQFAAWKRCKK